LYDKQFATIMDKTFALRILENMWFLWITMAALEFFSRKKICKGRKTTKEAVIMRSVVD